MKQARYTEPKARSAELLRLALGHMGRHEAAFNPVTPATAKRSRQKRLMRNNCNPSR